MALPTADPPPADPAPAGPPAPRRWRPGLALAALAAVLGGHWWLIQALAPAPAPAPPGGPPRSATALQVRWMTLALPTPAVAAPPAAATPVAVTPVVPARPATRPRSQPPANTTPDITPPGISAAAAPEGTAAADDAEPTPADTSTHAPEAAAVPEGDPPPPVYPTQLPAPAQLRYALRYNGRAGEALLGWRHDGQRYTLALEGRASPGDRPLVAQTSQGGLDATGLAPERHLDRRRGGSQQAANFRRDIGRIAFSGPAVDYPAWPGAQDRLSWLVQLAAILGAGHAAPEVQLFVVDARGAGSLWRLQRQPDQRLSTPMGEVPAQLWQRDPPRPEGLLVQAWLDPQRGHWPVQLRFTAPRSGDVFELRLLAEPQPLP